MEEKSKALEASRKEILNQARREAASIVTRARWSEKAIKEFRDWEKRGRSDYSASVRRPGTARRPCEWLGPEEEVGGRFPGHARGGRAGLPVMVTGSRRAVSCLSRPTKAGLGHGWVL